MGWVDSLQDTHSMVTPLKCSVNFLVTRILLLVSDTYNGYKVRSCWVLKNFLAMGKMHLLLLVESVGVHSQERILR